MDPLPPAPAGPSTCDQFRNIYADANRLAWLHIVVCVASVLVIVFAVFMGSKQLDLKTALDVVGGAVGLFIFGQLFSWSRCRSLAASIRTDWDMCRTSTPKTAAQKKEQAERVQALITQWQTRLEPESKLWH